MFILREMTFDGQEWNRELGNEFSIVEQKKNPEVFFQAIKQSIDCDQSANHEFYAERSFAWIRVGHDLILLSKEKEYYIMCSNGETFKRLRK